MTEIPKFTLHGEGEEQSIQPTLALRGWGALSKAEKEIALRQLENENWLKRTQEVIQTIWLLNQEFLRVCPGKNLHNLEPDETVDAFSLHGKTRRLRSNFTSRRSPF